MGKSKIPSKVLRLVDKGLKSILNILATESKKSLASEIK